MPLVNSSNSPQAAVDATQDPRDTCSAVIDDLAREVLRLAASKEKGAAVSNQQQQQHSSTKYTAPAVPITKAVGKASAGSHDDAEDPLARKLTSTSTKDQKLRAIPDEKTQFANQILRRVTILGKATLEQLLEDGSDNESTTSANQLPSLQLTRLARNNATLRQQSAPGAFSVSPGTAGAANNLVPFPPVASVIESPPNVSMEREGTRQDEGRENTAATLEAVRVDDITVKAEPVQDDSRQKTLQMVLGVSCCFILLTVVILSTTLTRPSNNANSIQEETLAPTYDPDTRLALLRELILQEVGPLYYINYISNKEDNVTDTSYSYETGLLQDTLDDPETPQHQALLWLAQEDSVVTGIRQPMLEAGFIDVVGNIPRNTTDDTTTHLRHFQKGHHRHLIGLERIIQRYALAVLYYSTTSNISDWTESFEFLGEQAECDWSGAILCNTNGTLIHLDLSQNNLVGTIPIELGLLATLEFLNLNGNLLQGSIPQSLSQLTGIKTFDVGGNHLTGTLSESLFEGWKLMESWSINNNMFSGTLPLEFGDLTNVKSLYCQTNKLEGSLPMSFWLNFNKLEELDLSSQNGFTMGTIATEIGMWSNLESLQGHDLNTRGTLPTQIGLLTQMTDLKLADNHMSGPLPSQLFGLSNLKFLTLSMNGFTGTVPTEILQLTSLEWLFFQNTRLTGDVGFVCDAVEAGILKPMDPLRFDMREVTNCSCCSCCRY